MRCRACDRELDVDTCGILIKAVSAAESPKSGRLILGEDCFADDLDEVFVCSECLNNYHPELALLLTLL